jgi:hypothetical protein
MVGTFSFCIVQKISPVTKRNIFLLVWGNWALSYFPILLWICHSDEGNADYESETPKGSLRLSLQSSRLPVQGHSGIPSGYNSNVKHGILLRKKLKSQKIKPIKLFNFSHCHLIFLILRVHYLAFVLC